MSVIGLVAAFLRAVLCCRAALAAENLALRQQLAALQHAARRPRLRKRDRIFWVWLSHLWSGWRNSLLIVQPETVVRWHKQGFRLYWQWKLRRKRPGRPKLDAKVRRLIRTMCRENMGWGSPRIQSELALLGITISQTTVDKYMVRSNRPPSQTWRSFLANHAGETAGVDFFTVPTATFRVLFAFVVLHHERRRIVHINVTANPTAKWTAQQIVEAFPFDETPASLLRDRDGIFGNAFRDRVVHMGIEETLTAPRSPWQNPFVERVIGSIRRECLDHVIVLNERHLRRILRSYVDYYNCSRTHLSLDRNAPEPREVEPPGFGRVIAIPQVGGLHHRYRLAA